MQKIKQLFDQKFERWEISLPEEDLRQRRRGFIMKNGCIITYKFGSENNRNYMDYFLSHRMTNDRLTRIYEDGETRLIASCWDMYPLDAEEEAQAKNFDFYKMVEEMGLLPDI